MKLESIWKCPSCETYNIDVLYPGRTMPGNKGYYTCAECGRQYPSHATPAMIREQPQKSFSSEQEEIIRSIVLEVLTENSWRMSQS